ncbi:MAG: ASKHA domain-containing protein [Lachnospiraceae bacterium]|nr:ASKHA domain-containing protein [Lachnospiraceae bacterium]
MIKETSTQNKNYGIAADIGTTTIAMQLIERTHGKPVELYTALNGQRIFGPDVISRIEASNNGDRVLLQNLIHKDLAQGIMQLTKQGNIKPQKMILAANTTMVHLLMGYSCKNLGVSPFTPVNLKTIHTTNRDLCNEINFDFPIMIYPGISAYVGGDITAGLYALGFDTKEKVSILIDFGTNGEIAIGNKERILVASTAIGPAFEGGNITHGCTGMPGAIHHVTIQNGKPILETIQNKPPIGICGTGAIEIIYELRKTHYLDKTGLLIADFFDDGYPITTSAKGKNIIFTQKDIREIQLAKSAVRAGIETLMRKYGINYDQVEHLYIAGGFGFELNANKAVGMGLLPKECLAKIKTVGNSSLRGCVLGLSDKKKQSRLQHIVDISSELYLGNDATFNSLFMEYMYF